MAISNTYVQIKRSTATSKPSTLNSGELAYSYVSNTLFIGTSSGGASFNIGGQLYTSTIDSATNLNTVNTLVKRDATGNASFGTVIGNLSGYASSANQLTNAQNFSISGGDITATAQSFNGTSGVVLNASLNNITGLTAGTYGSTTAVPQITVAANGRVTAISTLSSGISATSNFTVSGNTGSSLFYTGNTFYIQGAGGSGITTAETTTGTNGVNAQIIINTDTTIARTNTSAVGTQIFNTDISLPTNNMSVGGTLTVSNLAISGNITYANGISTLNITDPIIYLASNNSGNLVDIGFVGHFVGTGHSGDTSHYQHTGFVRDYNDNKWKLFSNVSIEPTTTVTFDGNTYYDTIKVGGIDLSSGSITSAGSISATSLSLTNALTVANGGTGATTFTTGNALIYNGTSFASLANVTSYSSQGSASYVPVITTDAYGRVTSITNTQISISASQISSGTLGITYGGTGSSSFTSGQRIVYNGTSLISQTNTGTPTLTGTLSQSNTITALNFNNYGEVTSFTASSIAIDTSQITTGTLGITRGGTGASSFNTNQLINYNGTSFASVANVTPTVTGSLTTNNTITSLTIDGYGRVTAYTGSAISGLTVGQGGTGLSTATLNGIVYGNGTGALGVTVAAGTSDQTWSNQILTVNTSGVPVWSSTLDGGSF